MTEANFILHLYSLPQTVFTTKEVSLIFSTIPYPHIRAKLAYFTKKGYLKRLRMGMYVKDKYEPLEFANKLYTPSYISLETVLQRAGIVFQYYETIFVVSYLSRRVAVDGMSIYYRKMNKDILYNTEGIEQTDHYAIATKERAFLDAIFLYKDYHFDNLFPLDWGKVHSLKKLYQSEIFERRVDTYYRLYIQEHAEHRAP